MNKKISKVAVLGSGIMGSGIACHLANVGLEVMLLDIVPRDLNDNEKEKPAARNRIVDQSLAEAIKSKPAPLYDKSFASRITTGNFEDDFEKINQCDWIIEVVIERLDIKKQIFEQVESYRSPGSLVSSNTSGIPIHMLAEGRSDDFKKHFCGTHFFNPARYMRLLEIIPHDDVDPAVIDFWMHYGDLYLGKQTVLAKDTPAFVGNRIGFYTGNKVNELTQKYNMKIEEVDSLTGKYIGWPSTGSFRLLDLVGIDTSMKVTKGVIENAPDDEYVQKMKDAPLPEYMEFLDRNKWYGNKSSQGFYKKTGKRDENGRSIILSLDLNTLEYRPMEKPRLDVIGVAKKIELMDKRFNAIVDHDSEGGKFLKELLVGTAAYASNRIPEISDNVYSIDQAMKSGYAWEYGPFEIFDFIGLEKTVALGEESGETFPQWVHDMIDAGVSSFYKSENGKRLYYDVDAQAYKEVPGTEDLIILDNYRDQEPVYENSECVIHDIGDGVMCLEFTSKSNAIGEGTGQGVLEAIRIAEEEGWKGIVIGNNDKNFSVGANLMGVGMYAMQGEWDKLRELVDGFQQMNMAMRYSKVPVVVATQGYVFGGGCEMLMHADAGIIAAESYIGLVEVGVGLIPGGGGTKEFARRAAEEFADHDVKIPVLVEKLRSIATANVSTSGHEGFHNGTLKEDRDRIVVNVDRVLAEAKEKVIDIADNGYTPPVPEEFNVLGRAGMATLYTAINEFELGHYMSEYDVVISRKVADVLCGGDLTQEQPVSEQYLLDMEQEAFLELLKNQKTQERIQHMLMNNKPLRN